MSRVTIATDVVENAKRELIEKIISNLDMDRIREICSVMHGIQDFESVDFKSGDITALQDQVVYRLEFDVTFKFPLLIDDKGNAVDAGMEEREPAQPAEERVESYGNEAAEAAHGL